MITAVILFCLAAMIYQDLKYRKVHMLWLAILFVGGVNTILKNYTYALDIILYNCMFFILVFGALIAYISIKNRQYINPFKNYFGLGDLLFYLAISPLFLFHNYIIFFILSMLFSIGLAFLFKKSSQRGIPLAGNSSILLIISICWDVIFTNPLITLIK